MKIERNEVVFEEISIGECTYYDYIVFTLPKEKGERIFLELGRETYNQDNEIDDSYVNFELCVTFLSGKEDVDEVILYPMYEKDDEITAGDFIYLENGEFDDCMELAVQEMKKQREARKHEC